jgi:general L-amino acid transport system permease protein
MAAPPKARSWSWRSKAFRGVLYQVIVLGLIVAAGAYLLSNTLENMRVRGIKSGFDFITQPAGFAIGESVVPFDSAESYGKAFLVGLSNTFRVAITGIVLATVIGTLVGIGRLSRNLLVRSLSGAYVDLIRNVPLLLQLFMWYFVLTEMLPSIEEAMHPLPGVFLSKNGLQFPHPEWVPGLTEAVKAALAAGPVGVGLGALGACASRRHRPTPMFVLPALVILVLATLAGWLIGGAPTALDLPEKTEINVVGGGA